MKSKIPSEDPALSGVLHQWKTDAPLPPRFAEGVWQRIERNERSLAMDVWSAFRGWLSGMFLRPSLAVSYVAVLLLLGLAAGYWQGRAGSQRVEERLRMQYVHAVDPYQQTH